MINPLPPLSLSARTPTPTYLSSRLQLFVQVFNGLGVLLPHGGHRGFMVGRLFLESPLKLGQLVLPLSTDLLLGGRGADRLLERVTKILKFLGGRRGTCLKSQYK